MTIAPTTKSMTAKREAKGITTPSYRAFEGPAGRPSSARKFDWYIEAWSFCCVYSIFLFLGDSRHEKRERDKAEFVYLLK